MGVPDGVETGTKFYPLEVITGGIFFVRTYDPPVPDLTGGFFDFKIGVHPEALESMRRLDSVDPEFVLRGDLPGWCLGTSAHFVGRILDGFKPFFSDDY